MKASVLLVYSGIKGRKSSIIEHTKMPYSSITSSQESAIIFSYLLLRVFKVFGPSLGAQRKENIYNIIQCLLLYVRRRLLNLFFFHFSLGERDKAVVKQTRAQMRTGLTGGTVRQTGGREVNRKEG